MPDTGSSLGQNAPSNGQEDSIDAGPAYEEHLPQSLLRYFIDFYCVRSIFSARKLLSLESTFESSFLP